MEGEINCKSSSAEKSVIEEVSDSSSSTRPSPTRKRVKCASNTSASKFKGVVPQQNGHWGCQIYANHQRIWLGTFKSEKEAATAYDSAAIKLRSGDCRRNFPPTDMTIEESKFQSHYSTEAVVNMIKDGSYQSKFADFIRTCSQSVETGLSLELTKPQNNGRLTCKQLFQKELTPSDVGKLNRLVIPKKFAVKFFPRVAVGMDDNVVGEESDDVQLPFYDRSMKLWKFRYCYWKSSQSYVFTRGWNRFVNEKQLKANDTITFCLSECGENLGAAQPFFLIDVNTTATASGLVEVSKERKATEIELQLDLCREAVYHNHENDIEDHTLIEPVQNAEKKGFKLFGVQIS